MLHYLYIKVNKDHKCPLLYIIVTITSSSFSFLAILHLTLNSLRRLSLLSYPIDVEYSPIIRRMEASCINKLFLKAIFNSESNQDAALEMFLESDNRLNIDLCRNCPVIDLTSDLKCQILRIHRHRQ